MRCQGQGQCRVRVNVMLTRSVRSMLRMFIVDAQMLVMKQLVKNICEFKPLMIRDCRISPTENLPDTSPEH